MRGKSLGLWIGVVALAVAAVLLGVTGVRQLIHSDEASLHTPRYHSSYQPAVSGVAVAFEGNSSNSSNSSKSSLSSQASARPAMTDADAKAHDAVLALHSKAFKTKLRSVAADAWRTQYPDKPVADCIERAEPMITRGTDGLDVKWNFSRFQGKTLIETEQISMQVDESAQPLGPVLCIFEKHNQDQAPASSQRAKATATSRTSSGTSTARTSSTRRDQAGAEELY